MKILKIHSLPPNQWVDRDYLMLHACFQILSDFVEKETPGIYDEFGEMDEIKELYDWWQKRKSDDDLHSEDNEMMLRLIKIRDYLWT